MPVIQYVTRAIALPASPRGVRDCIEHNDAWQMQDAERSTLAALLTWLKPKVSIEVGVFTAGSLGVIARESDHVYALDIDPTCEATYSSQFPNVTFITGDSKATLPRLLEELREAGSDVDFALIDGDPKPASGATSRAFCSTSRELGRSMYSCTTASTLAVGLAW